MKFRYLSACEFLFNYEYKSFIVVKLGSVLEGGGDFFPIVNVSGILKKSEAISKTSGGKCTCWLVALRNSAIVLSFFISG